MTKPNEKQEKKKTSETENDNKKQIDELTNLVKRIQADFENYKKRIETEQEQFRKIAAKHVLKDLLTIADNIELSLNHAHNPQEFQKGIELIKNQLHSLLESHNVKAVESKGKRFDPKYHEALMAEEADEEDIILEEFQKGYVHCDVPLRTAKVKVSKRRQNAAQTNPN